MNFNRIPVDRDRSDWSKNNPGSRGNLLVNNATILSMETAPRIHRLLSGGRGAAKPKTPHNPPDTPSAN